MARVLVVDDDETYRTLTGRVLEQMGHVVETEINGARALGRLADSDFDLIITDIFMPDMDGLEFIREKTKVTGAPVLAVSGGGSRVSMDFLKMAGLLGAGAILYKPFAVVDLGNAVTSLLNLKKPAGRAVRD